MIFKLGGGVDHVTCHVCSLSKVKRQGQKVPKRIDQQQERCNMAMNSHYQFQIRWELLTGGLVKWYSSGQ